MVEASVVLVAPLSVLSPFSDSGGGSVVAVFSVGSVVGGIVDGVLGTGLLLVVDDAVVVDFAVGDFGVVVDFGVDSVDDCVL